MAPAQKKSVILPKGVHGDVQTAAEDAPTIGQGRAEDDVGELADSGIRQAGLEVVLGHGHQRANENRGAGHIGQIGAQARVGEQVNAEDIDDDLEDGKTPALTTATACRSALTGAGATMAAGSQRWKGMSAALPVPKA